MASPGRLFTLTLVLILITSAGVTPLGDARTFALFVASLLASVYALHRSLKEKVALMNDLLRRSGGDAGELQRKLNSIAVSSLLLIVTSAVIGISLWSLYLFTGASLDFVALSLLAYGTVVSLSLKIWS